eukprot:gene21460-27495_t
MGKTKQQIAAAKRLAESGQKRDCSGGFIAKQRQIVEIVDSDSDESAVDSDEDENDWHSVVVEEEEEPEVENVDSIELEKEINEINLDLVVEKLKEYRARGDSDRSRRDRNLEAKKLAQSAKDMNNSILNYLIQANAAEVDGEIGSDVEDNLDQNDTQIGDVWTDGTRTEAEEKQMMETALERLRRDKSADITKDKKKLKKSEAIDKFKYLQYLSIKAYFKRRLRGESPIEASRSVAETIFSKFTAYSYRMVCIRKWAHYYLEHFEVKAYQFSKQPRTKTIITDEQVQIRLREHVRNIFPKIRRTPTQFMIDLNTDLLRTIPFAPVKVCIKTATRWMKVLGFFPKRHGKNYYVDGHERPDVVADRNERYLPAMAAYEKRISTWEGANMETEVPAVYCMESGLRRVINIVHDECIVYSNDATQVLWEENGRRELRPKSNGRSQHISGFCCSCHGFVRNDLGCTFTIITPGKNADGYWCNSDLVAQFEQVAPIFEQLHPGCQLVFTFDNSQNHHARLPGGLCAKKMLKGSGGTTQPLQREHTGTIYNGVEYTLWQYKTDKATGAFVLDAAGEKIKEMKGMAKILTERGVPNAHMTVDEMRLVLAEHHDFKNEKEWLAQAAEQFRSKTLFLYRDLSDIFLHQIATGRFAVGSTAHSSTAAATSSIPEVAAVSAIVMEENSLSSAPIVNRHKTAAENETGGRPKRVRTDQFTAVTALLGQVVSNQKLSLDRQHPIFEVLHIIRDHYAQDMGPEKTLRVNRFFASDAGQCHVFLEANEEERQLFLDECLYIDHH